MSVSASSLVFNNERRDYYRIEESAFLDYRIIPDSQLAAIVARFQEDSSDYFSSNRDYIENDKVLAAALARIQAEHPAVAIYLQALERKINLLAPLMRTKNNELENYPTRRINLSGGGIAFDVEQEIPLNTTVEIKLVLLPRYNGILAYGSVVYCERHAENEKKNEPAATLPWKVAVHFSHIREIDRDIIVRHVLQQQAAWLRRR